jgi:RHS repeat-associated protein
VSDASGAAVGTSKYSVDGASASLASEFGFTGQLWLPSVQLYYFKARMYSPQLGRFMQRDPLGYAAGLNLYAYAGGDPVNARDPSGLANEPTLANVDVIGDRCDWVCRWLSAFAGFQEWQSTQPGDTSPNPQRVEQGGTGGQGSQVCWNGDKGNWRDGVSGFSRQIGNDFLKLGTLLGGIYSISSLSPDAAIAIGNAFGANSTSAGLLGADLAPVAQLTLPVGRLGYAASVSRIPNLAGSAIEAVAMRNTLKVEYRLGAFSNSGMPTYSQLAATRTDSQILARAGSTNSRVNTAAGVLATSAATRTAGCK